MDTLTFDLLSRFARGKTLRRAHLDHLTTGGYITADGDTHHLTDHGHHALTLGRPTTP